MNSLTDLMTVGGAQSAATLALPREPTVSAPVRLPFFLPLIPAVPMGRAAKQIENGRTDPSGSAPFGFDAVKYGHITVNVTILTLIIK